MYSKGRFPSREWKGWLSIPLIGSFIHRSQIEKIPVIGWFAKGAEKAAFMSRVFFAMAFLVILAALWHLIGKPAKSIAIGEKAGEGATKTAAKAVVKK